MRVEVQLGELVPDGKNFKIAFCAPPSMTFGKVFTVILHRDMTASHKSGVPLFTSRETS